MVDNSLDQAPRTADGALFVGTVRPLPANMPTDDTGDQSYGAKTRKAEVANDVEREVQDQAKTAEAVANQEVTTPDPAADPTQQPAPVYQPTSDNTKQAVDLLRQGLDRTAAASYISETTGLDMDQADKQVIDHMSGKINETLAKGFTQEQVVQHLQEANIDPSVIDSAVKYAAADKSYQKLDFNPQDASQEQVEDMVSLYDNIYSKYSTLGKTVGGIFNEEMGVQARQEVTKLNQAISQRMNEKGFKTFINPETGEIMHEDKNDIQQTVDVGLWKRVRNSLGEAAGGIGAAAVAAGPAAVAATTVGAAIGTAIPIPGVGTLAGAAVGFGVVAGASAIGAAAGRGADMFVNALQLKEDLDARVYKTQMVQAGVFDLAVGVIGTAAFKTAAPIVKKSYDLAIRGNMKGAQRALASVGRFTKDQIEEITQGFMSTLEKNPVVKTRDLINKLTFGLVKESSRPLTQSEKQIIAMVNTQKEAISLAKRVAQSDPAIADIIAKGIDARAKDLTKMVSEGNTKTLGSEVRASLNAYEKDVKDFYSLVKETGAAHVNGTDFKFDIDKLAIDTIVNEVEKGAIADPAIANRFIALADRIQSSIADRSFKGLIDLRQAVNDFKYGVKSIGYHQKEALNKVISTIDSAIGKAAKEYIPNGEQWLKNFSKAKVEYAKMMQLRENVLVKGIQKAGKTEEQLSALIGKYINAADSTFNAVMDRLPASLRSNVENTVIDTLLKKNTLGKSTETQAINFPQLFEELQNFTFKSDTAKRTVDAIEQMARVFKNDPDLGIITGSIKPPAGSVFAGTDNFVQMSKFALTKTIWNKVMARFPGKANEMNALVNHASMLLDNPLNYKSVQRFMENIPKPLKEEVNTLVSNLQKAIAGSGAKPEADFVKMYKTSASGNLAKTKGVWGDGVYLVDKVKNAKPGANIVGHEVNMTRMATMEDISTVYGQELGEADLKGIKGLQEELASRGFTGIKSEGKVMLFPDNIVGTKLRNTIDLEPIESKIDKRLSKGKK